MADKTEYLIDKVTTGFRFCTNCSGSGIAHERAYHNQTIPVKCLTCRGTGRVEIKHTTRATLIEALKDLNLIK